MAAGGMKEADLDPASVNIFLRKSARGGQRAKHPLPCTVHVAGRNRDPRGLGQRALFVVKAPAQRLVNSNIPVRDSLIVFSLAVETPG